MRYELPEIDRHGAIIALRGAGLRATLPRLAILGLLRHGTSMTPPELAHELSDYRFSRTTVHRCLAALKKAGLVHDVSRNGIAHVELTQRMGRHTHSLFCVRCNWTQVFQNQIIEQAITSIAAKKGLAAATHEVTIRGKCRECRKRAH